MDFAFAGAQVKYEISWQAITRYGFITCRNGDFLGRVYTQFDCSEMSDENFKKCSRGFLIRRFLAIAARQINCYGKAHRGCIEELSEAVFAICGCFSREEG